MIPGVTVSPGSFKTVLICAVGPGLESFGVADFQARPVLTLYAGSEAFLSNAGWADGADPEAIARAARVVGAFALQPESADAAILAELGPGSYTLHVSSGNETEGVALVEVYELP
mgnify:CR=1 FL=1